MSGVVLHGSWLSSCTWRVRACLRYKGINYTETEYELINKKQQLTDQFRAVNPAQKVPTMKIVLEGTPRIILTVVAEHTIIGLKYPTDRARIYYRLADSIYQWPQDGVTIIESMAILQYLEEIKPTPSLTPATPLLRARVREICDIIVSGIQPLQNVSLIDHTKEQFEKIALHYTARGLAILDALLANTTDGKYCIEGQLTMADLCLVPQVYNAITRRKLDISKYPNVYKVYNHLIKQDFFRDTHPEKVKSRL